VRDELGEDAADFFSVEREVVGPLDLAVEGASHGYGRAHSDEPGLFLVGIVVKDYAHGERVAEFAVPGTLEPSATLGLVVGEDDGGGFAPVEMFAGDILGTGDSGE